MMDRIMMVIGDCDPQVFSSVQFSVNEKLTRQDETGVLYTTADEISDHISVSRAVNELLAKVDPDSSLDKHYVSVTVLFDRDIDRIPKLTEILKDIESIRNTTGIWNFTFHLIWFVDEFPGLRYTYSDMLELFAKEKEIYTNIYILSDRHSDLGHGRDKRLNGAANLISALLNGRPTEGGLYSVGVGKMKITSYEMREYAKHKAADALKGQLFRWTDFRSMDDICASAFNSELEGAERFPDWLNEMIGSRLMTTFAVARGESSVCSSVGELTSSDFSELFETWFNNMKQYVEIVPFTERIIDYFEENGDFQEFQAKTEQQIFAKTLETVKPGFLASSFQKEVINNYNAFIREEQEVIKKGLAAFMKQWPVYVLRIKELAKQQIVERDRILQIYRRDDQFIQLCESVAGETTNSIQNELARLTVSADQYNAFSDDENFSEEKAGAMMDWIAEKTCKAATPMTIMDTLAGVDPGRVVTDVLHPMISKSKTYLACPVSANLLEPKSTYLFTPQKLYNGQFPGLIGVNVIPVITDEYQNIEAVSLIQLSDADHLTEGSRQLTAFVGKADPAMWAAPAKKEQPAQTGSFYRSHSDKAEKAAAPQEADNPWQIDVQQSFGGYQATFNWDDDIAKLSLHVDGENGQGSSIHLTKSNFLMQGYVNIDHMVGFGAHTLSLLSAGKVISRHDFIGRRHQIEVETESSDFQLDKTILLQQVELKVVSVDGDSKASLTSDVCSNLCLLLDRKDQLNLPQPWIKHKQQGWTVIMEDKAFEPIVSGPYANIYELHIV